MTNIKEIVSHNFLKSSYGLKSWLKGKNSSIYFGI